jgi:hypothetical protein
MKKIVAILLLVFYMGSSNGATIYFHYCMDELVGLGFSGKAKSDCSDCGMPKGDTEKDVCCKDVKHEAKSEKIQKISPTIYKPDQSPVAVIRISAFTGSDEVVSSETVRHTFSKAPPSLNEIPIYLRNCTYRI